MSLAVPQPMTMDAFLAWEERQEMKHEFDGVRPVAMVGGTNAHWRIQRNLAISIGCRLRGKPCEFLGSDARIITDRTVRYSDGLVTCRPGAGQGTSVSDPVILFEVLSPYIAGIDRITKNQEYAAIPSVQRYVML